MSSSKPVLEPSRLSTFRVPLVGSRRHLRDSEVLLTLS